MKERRRTRSQGPPSIAEDNELIQWNSLPNRVRIEREQVEARRQARQVNRMTYKSKNNLENNEISQALTEQPQYTENIPKSGQILPNQQKESDTSHTTPSLSEIPQKKQQETDLVAMEEGAVVKTPMENTQQPPIGESSVQNDKDVQ